MKISRENLELLILSLALSTLENPIDLEKFIP